MLCHVITRSRSPGIGSGLTYDSGDLKVKEGSHVSVPLRKELVEGIVLEIIKNNTQPGCHPELAEGPGYDVKNVDELLSNSPLLNKAQIQTLKWMSEYYFCTLRQALQAWIPTPVFKKRKKKDEFEKLPEPEINEPKLTTAQKKAYEKIKSESKPSLLFGITSSGKTEIYAQLICDTIKNGKQAILLLPEILLTEHFIHRFEELLGAEYIAIVHSRLTPAQRRKTWNRIHQGHIKLVIGSRSALFSPVPDLGLVIIDEEHEWTYKNEQTPRYHARETAAKLCEFSKAKLVLGTATPSLESWARAKSGEYQLVRLSERYLDQPLPKVRVIDLAEVASGSLYPFSPPLLDAISDRLKKGEQTVLFLNRRGVSSSLMCLDCRRRIVSPESNLPFTLHKDRSGRPYLLDHTTGICSDVPATCPACNSTKLHAIGAGTQKLEEILTKQFFEARILRADSDTLTHPEHMRLLLKKMRENQADILLGTQSVVKGLDLPNVTLAGVLVADVGLSLPHFRAGERIFQLLTQLTGRSGRAKAGEVIIQTFRPAAPEIKFAAEHKTEEFLEEELKLRIHSNYPPATKMIRLIVRENAKNKAEELRDKIRRETDLLAHASSQIFGGGTWQVLIRGPMLATGTRGSLLRNLDLKGVTIDVDPVETV